MVFHPRDPAHRSVSQTRLPPAVARRRRRPAHGVRDPRRVQRRRERSPGARRGGPRPPLRHAGQPGHAAALRRQPADRLRPRARRRATRPLQLGAVHLEAGRPGLRQEVRGRGQGRDLLQHGAGDPEVPDRRGRRRRLLPDDRLPPQARRGQADPAPEPRLHPQADERLAGAPGPVLRQGVAVLGAVHDLHDGHRMANGHRSRRASKSWRPAPTPTRSSGTPTTRARWGSTTRTARRSRSGCTATS